MTTLPEYAHTPTPEAALERLLLDLFTWDELRVWCGHQAWGADVWMQIPVQPTPELGAHELVGALVRRELIDLYFFRELTRARPRKAADIDAVMLALGAHRVPRAGVGLPRPSETRPVRLLAFGMAAIVLTGGVLVTIGFIIWVIAAPHELLPAP